MTIPPGEIESALTQLGFTHVVWLPDSVTGRWEEALEGSSRLTLVRVCREGEAWALAAGLHVGGKRPLVVIQNTGFFESGDATRNVLFDMKLPLYALVGYRNYLTENSPDTARRFTEPLLAAWGLDYVLLGGDEPLVQLARHYQSCQRSARAGVALLPQGSG